MLKNILCSILLLFTPLLQAFETIDELLPNTITSISSLPNLKQKLQKRDRICEPYINELTVVKVPYIGFDHKEHTGAIIIHQALSQDILEIFQVLHQHQFPIEKIHPFGNGSNVTLSYNCRLVTDQKGILSQHSFGRAIDINPLLNPYVKGDMIIPPSGKKYIDRALNHQGQISKESLIYTLFAERGWDWGGSWYDLLDYQHFEKRANGEKRNPYGYDSN